ncbi:hypothetical protein SNE40_013434 [Patella caerulea]
MVEFIPEVNFSQVNTSATNLSELIDGYEYEHLHAFVRLCNNYLIPIIIVTGMLGNGVSFLVFLFSNLRSVSSSVYLAALAVSETGFLICAGISWLDSAGVTSVHVTGVCQMLVYVTYVFSFTSVWFITALTTEIYIAIFYMDIAIKMCNRKSARAIVCSLMIFSVVLYSFSFWTSETITVENHVLCVTVAHAGVALVGISLTDTALTLVVPFTLLIFMNTRILIDVMRWIPSRRRSRKHENAPLDATAEVDPADGRFKAQRQMKKTLITTVVAFLVLNLPSHALRLQAFFRSMIDVTYRTTDLEHLLQQIFQVLYYLNFSVNFIIYNACAKGFRKVLMRMPNTIRQLCAKKSHTQHVNEVCRKPEHSRLVEMHLSQLHWSQMAPFESDFVVPSPPCYIQEESEE